MDQHRKLGSFGCPQCGGAVDVLEEQGLLVIDKRDCEHDFSFTPQWAPMVDLEQVKEQIDRSIARLEQLTPRQRGEALSLYLEGAAADTQWEGFEPEDLKGVALFLGDLTLAIDSGLLS